jgi:hypothetical protein
MEQHQQYGYQGQYPDVQAAPVYDDKGLKRTRGPEDDESFQNPKRAPVSFIALPQTSPYARRSAWRSQRFQSVFSLRSLWFVMPDFVLRSL